MLMYDHESHGVALVIDIGLQRISESQWSWGWRDIYINKKQYGKTFPYGLGKSDVSQMSLTHERS